jgi:hypothetical protein
MKCIQNFGGKTYWKEAIWLISRGSWEDNIQMDLREISCETDATGSSGSCSLKGFGISCIEPSDFISGTFTILSHVGISIVHFSRMLIHSINIKYKIDINGMKI